jgi:hypothetical protein
MRTTERSAAPGWEWLVVLAVLGTFLLGLPALIALPAERILFAPGVYKQALVAQGFYQEYPAWLGEIVAPGLERFLPGSGEEMRRVLGSDRFQRVLEEVFPQVWVRGQAESLIDQFWAFFNLNSDQLRLVVDFGPVKENLSGPGSPRIVTTIVEGLPACNADELFEYGLRVLSGEAAGLPLCRPPEQLVGLSNTLVGGLLQAMAPAIPDQVDLATAARFTAGLEGQAWRNGFAIYRVFRLALPWMPVAAVLGLFATGLLGLLTRRGPFFWTGLVLLLTGFTGLLVALLSGLWGSQAAPLIVQSLFGDLVISQALADVIAEVFRRFVTSSAVLSLMVFLVGAGLVAGTILWQSRTRGYTI